MYVASMFVAIIGVLFIFQQFFSSGFCPGIRPGSVDGLYGLVTYPLFHGSVSHLFSNLPPLFFLLAGLFYYFPRKFFPAVLSIWLLSAAFIWIVGHKGCHLGASGIIYGVAFFMAAIGIIKKQRNLGAFALIIVFLYGGMIWGVLPQEGNISWEGHAGGALSGILLAILWSKTPVYTEQFETKEQDEEEQEEMDQGDENMHLSQKGTTIHYHFTKKDEA
ncbi:MAG: rhomboid family intramembrane serine protease [Salinivirgaceae bacterium]|jgi:membrane associated rhomboid family serine protease|nr:rhomboid family intramembrane serine protease [Salinivirgaceae bacterium]